ncbi:MAG: hypothetical protein P8Y45_06680 [Exilibacterium sp.]
MFKSFLEHFECKQNAPYCWLDTTAEEDGEVYSCSLSIEGKRPHEVSIIVDTNGMAYLSIEFQRDQNMNHFNRLVEFRFDGDEFKGCFDDSIPTDKRLSADPAPFLATVEHHLNIDYYRLLEYVSNSNLHDHRKSKMSALLAEIYGVGYGNVQLAKVDLMMTH